MSYKLEEIPNSDTLFMRAHVKLLKKQNFDLADPVPPNIFREHQGAMSTDWNKYSTLEQTRARGNPNLNGVIGMKLGDVRNIPPLEVIHTYCD